MLERSGEVWVFAEQRTGFCIVTGLPDCPRTTIYILITHYYILPPKVERFMNTAQSTLNSQYSTFTRRYITAKPLEKKVHAQE